MLRHLIPVAVALSASALSFFQPKEASAQTLLIHTVSVHAAPGYNNRNFGIGYRDESGLTLGGYCNSESFSPRFPDAPTCKTSLYLAQSWDWKVFEGLEVGVSAGVLSGYSRAKLLPFVIPSVRFADRYRVLFAPAIEPKGVSVLSLVLEFQ